MKNLGYILGFCAPFVAGLLTKWAIGPDYPGSTSTFTADVLGFGVCFGVWIVEAFFVIVYEMIREHDATPHYFGGDDRVPTTAELEWETRERLRRRYNSILTGRSDSLLGPRR